LLFSLKGKPVTYPENQQQDTAFNLFYQQSCFDAIQL